jgi:hypothetical protein
MQSQYRRRTSKSSFSSRSGSFVNSSHIKRTHDVIPDNNAHLYGYALLIATFVTFFLLIYAIVTSKRMPPSGNKVIKQTFLKSY